MNPKFVDIFPCKVAMCDNVLPTSILKELAIGSYKVWEKLNTNKRAFGRQDRTPLEELNPELFTIASNKVSSLIETWYGYKVTSICGVM